MRRKWKDKFFFFNGRRWSVERGNISLYASHWQTEIQQWSDIYRSPILSCLQEMLTFYCHSFEKDTLLFCPQPEGIFVTFLFSDGFLHKKLAPFPVTSHQLYFRLTCSLACSSGVTVDFVHMELPGGSAFVLLLRKGQILWAFWHH